MKSRVIISENDRRNILSMYGVLTEESTTRIVGKIVVIDHLVVDTSREYSLQNIKIDLYGDSNFNDGEVLGDNNDIVERNLIDSTVTNSGGNYTFNNVKDNNNLLMRVSGNEFFKPKDVTITSIKPNQDNTVNIEMQYKVDPIEPTIKKTKPTKTTVSKCEKKESNDKRIFGYGEQSKYVTLDVFNNYKTEESKLIDSAIKSAVVDAFTDYLKLFPNENATVDKMTQTFYSTNNNDLPKLRVICKKSYTGTQQIIDKNNPTENNQLILNKDAGNLVATSVVKFRKDELDKMVSIMVKPKPEPPRKIEFDNYDFQKALEDSWDFKKKIFLFVCSDMDKECNTLLTDFVRYGNLDQKLKGYVRLYYKVDRSQSKKYVLASESLDIDTYPTVVILEASNDPRKNYIKDSVKIIKKITQFNQTPGGMSNLIG